MTLNPKQIRIVIASVVIFIAMGLIPPWTYTISGRSVYRDAGYALIFAPPTPEEDSKAFGVRLDISRLLVQWFVLAAATGGAVLLAKGSRAK